MESLMTQNTIVNIAKRIGEPPHVVDYIVRSRKIKPAARVGIIRLFDDAGIAQIKQALRELRQYRPAAVSA